MFSVAAFAVLALMPKTTAITDSDVTDVQQESGWTFGSSGPNFNISGLTPEQRRALGDNIMHLLPRVMFVLVPVCALLFKLLARKARLNYPQHLYFALHVHAAYFALLALTTPLDLLGRTAGVWGALGRLVYILPYTAIAFRRVYGYSRLSSSLRTFVAFWIYMTILFVAFLLTVIAAYYRTRT